MLKWFHRLGSPKTFFELSAKWHPWLLALSMLSLTSGIIWALLFVPPDYQQGNSVRIMYIHVPAAILAQSGYMMMAGAAAVFLIWRMKLADMAVAAIAPLGAAMTFLALVTGAIWGKPTWGAWWVSDPQLNGALVTVLLYSGYLILRAAMGDDDRVGRLSAVYNVFAFVMLVILLMVLPRYTESLHPGKDGNPGFNSYDLDNSLRAVFYPAVIGWGALCYWMYTLRLRMNRLSHALLTQ